MSNIFSYLEKQGLKDEFIKRLQENESLLKIHKNHTNNPCFFSFLIKSSDIPLEKMVIKNVKTGEEVNIKSLLENKDYYQYEKDEIIFLGIDDYREEYHVFLDVVLTNYKEFLKEYQSFRKQQELEDFKPLSKYNKNYLIFISFLLGLNFFYLNTIYVPFLYGLYYGVLLCLLVLILMFKWFIITFINNQTLKQAQINLYDVSKKCDEIQKSHDANMEVMEKEILNQQKFISLKGCHETNEQLYRLKGIVENSITKQSKIIVNRLFKWNEHIYHLMIFLLVIIIILTILI